MGGNGRVWADQSKVRDIARPNRGFGRPDDLGRGLPGET